MAVPINSKHRTAYGRLADQRGHGYETLKVIVISKSEIINEPGAGNSRAPRAVWGFASCFGTEHEGNPSSL